MIGFFTFKKKFTLKKKTDTVACTDAEQVS